jgi:hypothetical protein
MALMSHRIDVEVPAERAFQFVTTPRNWEKFHPATVGVTGDVDHSARRGDRIVEQADTAAGFKGELIWTVIEHRPPERWAMEGWFRIGRLWRREAATITWSFASNGDGSTEVKREMAYSPGLLAPIHVLVRGREERECAEAMRRLKGVLEAR